jgi:hypothetical protein
MATLNSFLDLTHKHTLDSINWGDNELGEVIVVKYHVKGSDFVQNFWDFNYFAPGNITVDESKIMRGFLEYHGVPYQEAADQINSLLAQFGPRSKSREKVVKCTEKNTKA